MKQSNRNKSIVIEPNHIAFLVFEPTHTHLLLHVPDGEPAPVIPVTMDQHDNAPISGLQTAYDDFDAYTSIDVKIDYSHITYIDVHERDTEPTFMVVINRSLGQLPIVISCYAVQGLENIPSHLRLTGERREAE